MFRWVVFGTLLGPEATGPWLIGRIPLRGSLWWWGVGLVFLVSWLHRARTCVWGVWYGVVV